jgi:hypothetical protein
MEELFLNAETNLYNKLFTPDFLLRFGYYDTITKKFDNDIFNYSKSDSILPDIFNMDDLANYLSFFDEESENYGIDFLKEFFSNNVKKNSETEPISFTIPKTSISRREYKMPNIYSYLDLVFYLVKEKEQFIKNFKKNNHSTSKFFNELNFNFSITNEIKQDQLSDDNKLLNVDLSNFYPSLYTHTLSWIINGRNNAKVNRNRGFANELDQLIENCQFGETHGIPTGNLITRIISELYMCYFDERLEKQIGHSIKFSRYVDDFSYMFTYDAQKEKFLQSFRFICREYCLIINEQKTKVTIFPFPNTMDKDSIFNYFNNKHTFKIKKKMFVNDLINDINSFIKSCIKEESIGNKGALKSCFPVVEHLLKKLIRDKALTSMDINYIFSFKHPITNLNIFQKFLVLSLHDSKLTNRFIRFTKLIFDFGLKKENARILVEEYLLRNKYSIKAKLNFYKDNKFNQEVYQILLYQVFFGCYNFFEKNELLSFIDDTFDDYTICLSTILYLKKFNLGEYCLIYSINKLFLKVDNYYNWDGNNKKTPIMAEKLWLYRYFVYDLIKNNYIKKKSVINFYNRFIEGISSVTDFDGEDPKILLNYEYAFGNSQPPKINNFFMFLLDKNIHFVSFGNKNDFVYL